MTEKDIQPERQGVLYGNKEIVMIGWTDKHYNHNKWRSIHE